MKKKYLHLHLEWLEDGLPSDGLCKSLDRDEALIELLSPTGLDNINTAAYWGWGGEKRTRKYQNANFDDRMFSYTPLRQNIVLFLAAMNNEL